MVSHTANFDATVAVVECLDEQVGQTAAAADTHEAALMVTADHGNCDQMVDARGRPHTQHTTNPGPCAVVDRTPRRLRPGPGGGLGNIAPTMLDLMGIERPIAHVRFS